MCTICGKGFKSKIGLNHHHSLSKKCWSFLDREISRQSKVGNNVKTGIFMYIKIHCNDEGLNTLENKLRENSEEVSAAWLDMQFEDDTPPNTNEQRERMGKNLDGTDFKGNQNPICEDTENPVVIGHAKTHYERIKELLMSQSQNVLSPFKSQQEWDIFKFIHDSLLTKLEVGQLLKMDSVSNFQ